MVHRVETSLSAYPQNTKAIAKYYEAQEQQFAFEVRTGALNVQPSKIFSGSEIYGKAVWYKLKYYRDIVAQLALDLPFDIIHAHDWITFPAARKIKELTKKPLVLHIHSLETDRVGADIRNEIYEIERIAMEAADRIIPVSQFTKEKIVEHYHIDPDKIVPVHNGIDPKAVDRWRHIIPEKIVTFLGRITIQKGPKYLLETAEKVVRKYPNVKFVVAGKGDLLQPLLKATAYRGLSKHFVFVGFLSRADVEALLATTDVYFMPSVSEPFGLTALEAAQAGVPCVLTKQSGASELLTAALTADFWDTDLFAKHICQLLTDNELHSSVVQKTFEQLDAINWDNAATKVASVYAELLHEN